MFDFSKIYSDEKSNSLLADYIKSQIKTFVIAKVVKVTASTQRVDVQPCLTVKIEDKDSNTKIYARSGKKVGVSELEMPVILDVPLSYLRAGNFMITLPVKAGDYGKLLFSHQDISVWKERGGEGVEQKNLEQFDINNCVFEPYIASTPDAVSDYNADALEIRDGVSIFKMDGSGTINITGDLVVTGDVTANGISLESHTHSVSVPSTPYSGSTGGPS